MSKVPTYMTMLAKYQIDICWYAEVIRARREGRKVVERSLPDGRRVTAHEELPEIFRRPRKAENILRM